MTLWTMLACTPGTVTLDDSGAPSVETGDSEHTGETGNEDTAETGLEDALIVSGVLRLDASPDLQGDPRAVVVHANLDSGLVVGEPRGQSSLGSLQAGDNEWSVPIDASEPDDSLFQLNDQGFEMALFITGVYVDTDGDELPGPKDRYVGGSLRLLGYARGPIPAEWGLSEGWFVLQLDFSDGAAFEDLYQVSAEADGFDFVGNLMPRSRKELNVAADFPRDGELRVDLFAVAPLIENGVVPQEPTVSTAVLAPGDTGIVLPGPLGAVPPDHLLHDEQSAPGLLFGYYAAVAYVDANGSHGWNVDSEPAVATSFEAGRLALHARPTSFAAIFYPEVYGWPMGWFLVETDEDQAPGVVDWSEGLALVLSAEPQ